MRARQRTGVRVHLLQDLVDVHGEALGALLLAADRGGLLLGCGLLRGHCGEVVVVVCGVLCVFGRLRGQVRPLYLCLGGSQRPCMREIESRSQATAKSVRRSPKGAPKELGLRRRF